MVVWALLSARRASSNEVRSSWMVGFGLGRVTTVLLWLLARGTIGRRQYTMRS